jgi:hypothetical protein
MEKDKNKTVQVLILDADRNPIKNQKYEIAFNGIVIRGQTGADGLAKRIHTQTSHDEIQIAIERIDKSLKIIGRVISGCGNKLVTLVSPKIKLEGPTLLHPKSPAGQIPLKNEKNNPLFEPRVNQPPTVKKELGPITESTATKDGKALIKVTGDIPNLEFLSDYNGEVMGEVDFLWAARELDIELAAIKAFAEVESKGSGFIKIGVRVVPKILYERHKFAKFTDNKYSLSYPDISLPCGYYKTEQRYVLADEQYKKKNSISKEINFYRPIGKSDDEKTVEQSSTFKKLIEEKKLSAERHRYLDGLAGYKRLVKAYQLDPDAALKSCSWGAFQIMGEFWGTMKYASIQEFTKAISRSEKEQIKSFVLYMKYVNPRIGKLLRNLDWDGVAAAFNGPDYKVNRYDEKLADAYEKFRGSNG